MIYLETPIEVQVERTNKDDDRPLLQNGDPKEILTRLHEERENLYKEVSDHIIPTKNKSSQSVADEIINVVKKNV